MGSSLLPHPKPSGKQTAASKSMNTEVHALGQSVFLEVERAKRRGDPNTKRSQTKLLPEAERARKRGDPNTRISQTELQGC